MVIVIGTATSHAQIQAWKEASKEVGVALTMEVWETFDSGGRVSARVGIYQPDLHPLWYKLVDELRKEGKEPNGWHVERLEKDTIRSLKEIYQVKYDATPEGQQIIANRKAAERKKAEAEVREHFSRPDVKKAMANAFLKHYEETSLLCWYRRMKEAQDVVYGYP